MKQCNGICHRYQFKKKGPAGSNWFVSGVKRCRVCSLFLRWEGLLCPCCKCRLSTRSRQGRRDIKVVSDDD